MPSIDKYRDNSYINVYEYFCTKIKQSLPQKSTKHAKSKDIHPLKHLYDTGLELQQKLDKITKYDQCNEDTAKVLGNKEYCLELFKNGETDF